MSRIPFNKPTFLGNEFEYMMDAVRRNKICGDGVYTKKCDSWIENKFDANKAMLTTSCSTALDMSALLCGIKPGDEVILPSFTFPSTANSFVLVGAKLVFVDIRPDTMNIDENKIEDAITEKTRVIVPVHYAGVGCEMDTIMNIARQHDLMVVEDAAQGVMSTYKGRYLGTIGDFGTYSFHETKNYSMGEGGAILVNNAEYIERAEILREKGTNRSQFYRGQIAKYEWVDFGDSYLQSDLNAAFLWAQLEKAEEININRLRTWNRYYDELKCYEASGKIELPTIPDGCIHNAHMFYIKFKDKEIRQNYIRFMGENDILVVFHYVPLHSAPAGKKFGRFHGVDEYTTKESDRLVRLPMYYNIASEDVDKVIEKTREFINKL